MDAQDVVGWILAAAAGIGGLAYWRHQRERDRIRRAEQRTAAELDPRRREAQRTQARP